MCRAPGFHRNPTGRCLLCEKLRRSLLAVEAIVESSVGSENDRKTAGPQYGAQRQIDDPPAGGEEIPDPPAGGSGPSDLRLRPAGSNRTADRR